MITEQEVKEIISKTELTDIEMLSVIRKYIYDKKGIDIKDINRPVGILSIIGINPVYDYQLMLIAFDKASEYYFNK